MKIVFNRASAGKERSSAGAQFISSSVLIWGDVRLGVIKKWCCLCLDNKRHISAPFIIVLYNIPPLGLS